MLLYDQACINASLYTPNMTHKCVLCYERVNTLCMSLSGPLVPLHFDFWTDVMTLKKSTFYSMKSHCEFHCFMYAASCQQANDRGDYFPLWGTCLGFQLLSVIQANNDSILSHVDAENYPIPLTLTQG